MFRLLFELESLVGLWVDSIARSMAVSTTPHTITTATHLLCPLGGGMEHSLIRGFHPLFFCLVGPWNMAILGSDFLLGHVNPYVQELMGEQPLLQA